MKRFRKFYLYILAVPKTILFNFYYFPFLTAIRFPVLVSHRVWLMKMGGEVKLSSKRTTHIKIGFGNVGIFDQHRSRTIWKVTGTVEFRGKAAIGHGSKIAVTGRLVLGKKLHITAESSIVVATEVSIGDNVIISWDSLIMDTDFHDIMGEDGELLNAPEPISIADNVWIGCRTLILKGTVIPKGSVVAAASTVTKPIAQENVIIGGSPARIIKEHISWKK